MKIATLILGCLAPLFFISCKSQEKRKMEEAVTGVVNTKIRPVIQNNLNKLIEPLKKQAVPLSEAEKKAFKGYFKDTLLNSVQIVRVAKLPNLTFSDSFIQALAEHDINVGRLAVGKIQGMTFDKTIIIKKDSDELNTIFHELVHVVQYQILGVEGFYNATTKNS